MQLRYSNCNLIPFFSPAIDRARYEDARFFYKMDTQKKFSEFRPHLNGILFHVSCDQVDHSMYVT